MGLLIGQKVSVILNIIYSNDSFQKLLGNCSRGRRMPSYLKNLGIDSIEQPEEFSGMLQKSK